MKLKIEAELHSGNGAPYFFADVLRIVAAQCEAGNLSDGPKGIRDANGNTIGSWSLTSDDEDQ